MSDDIRRLFEHAGREIRPEFQAQLLGLVDEDDGAAEQALRPDQPISLLELDLGRERSPLRRGWHPGAWLGVAAGITLFVALVATPRARDDPGAPAHTSPPTSAPPVSEDEPGGGTVVPETNSDSLEPSPSTTTPPAVSTAELCSTGEYPSFGAFDLASGALDWSICSPDEARRTVIGASDEVALVAESSDNGSVAIAVDVRDGVERWRLSMASGLGLAPGPIAGSGIAVLDTDVEGAPFVIGVDIATGFEQWRIEPGYALLGHTDDIAVVSATPEPLSSAPVGPPGSLRGIDRATGEQRWVNDDVVFNDQSGVGVARGASAIAGTTIAVPTGSTLTAVDTITGAVLWTAPQLDHPVAADGVIVGTEPAQSGNGTLRALDATTGQTIWSAPGIRSYGDLLAIGDGVVVVISSATPGELVAYELTTGVERWRIRRNTDDQPHVVTGDSLVALWAGDLAAYSTTDGSLAWALTQPLRSPLMSSVSNNETTAFVAVDSLPSGD